MSDDSAVVWWTFRTESGAQRFRLLATEAEAQTFAAALNTSRKHNLYRAERIAPAPTTTSEE